MNAEVLILRSKLLAKGEVKVYLTGNCMQPLLMDGDSVVIVSAEQLVTGDLCLIELPGESLALHRLICKKDHYYIFKGDRDRRAEALNESAVIGKASKAVINGVEITIQCQ